MWRVFLCCFFVSFGFDAVVFTSRLPIAVCRPHNDESFTSNNNSSSQQLALAATTRTNLQTTNKYYFGLFVHAKYHYTERQLWWNALPNANTKCIERIKHTDKHTSANVYLPFVCVQGVARRTVALMLVYILHRVWPRVRVTMAVEVAMASAAIAVNMYNHFSWIVSTAAQRRQRVLTTNFI